MEANLVIAPFSFGIIPNFSNNLEFEANLNVAAFVTSLAAALPPPSTFVLSNQSSASAEAVVVSIFKRNDRRRALEACLDGDSLMSVRRRRH